MAYRRKQGAPRSSSALRDEFGSPHFSPPPPDDSLSSSSATSLAAKAIRASSAYRDSSLSSAYGHSGFSPSRDSPGTAKQSPSYVPRDSVSYANMSTKSSNEPRRGFWGVLASKAKSILEDENVSQQFETPERTRQQTPTTIPRSQHESPGYSPVSNPKKMDNPALQKGLGAITSSLSYIGGTIGNALEEGLNIVENRTAEIIQETRKLQLRKKDNSSGEQNDVPNVVGTWQKPKMQTRVQPQTETALETQLKASRDVAMAMAAKAKLLLRELKTFKADLAFAKERCAQLEEENRILRESLEKGDNPEDDDLIRLQLETLLAEKARLAQENSVFARENRFLREIVEYHQLTMQDVVYFDEGSEEVTEVYPIIAPVNTIQVDDGKTQISNQSAAVSSKTRLTTGTTSSQLSQDICPVPVPPPGLTEPLSSFIDITTEEDLRRH